MEEFLGEFLKIRTWIFGILYWAFIIWQIRRTGVKIGVRGIILFGVVFAILLLMTLAHPIAGCFLIVGFVFLVHEISKGASKH